MNFSYSLTENARRYPDRTAVVDGEVRLTYSQFNQRVNSLADGFRQLGLGRGSRVALLMWNCPEFLEAYYATMRIGATVVPLNYRLAADEVRHELHHCRADAVVTETQFHDLIERISGDVPTLSQLITTADEAPAGWIAHASLTGRTDVVVPDEPVSLDDIQRIMYTSGTTSRPRAVIITHGQVYWGAMSRVADFSLTPDDVNLTVGPLYHVGALDTNCTAILFVGGTVVIHEKFVAAAVAEAIDAEGITNLWMAPSMVNMVFQLPDVGSYAMTTLRILVLGGEKMPRPLLERVLSEWPQVGVYDGYGMTEAQGLVTILPAEFSTTKLGSVGWAGRGREIKLIDDDGNEVGPGEPGELLVRGPLVFPGYLDDEEATRATLVDGWLHSGDMAIVDEDGFYYIIDRKKDMIRSGGENIAASEVERVIDEIAEVAEVAVVAKPDEKWIEVPTAFIVLKAGSELSHDDVIGRCVARLASFKVPRTILFVDSLPRNPSGKVLKKDLRARFDV